MVKTKGGTTCIASFGPPFAPFQNFHSSKSCSKPSDSTKTVSFHEKKHFFIEKQVFQFLKLWSRPKGGPHALHPLVPPLLHFKIFTHQNLARNHPILTKTVSFHEKKHFFIEKQVFQFLKLWSRPKGGPHALHPLVPPLLHFKIFTHQNLARNHPILTKTVSFHEKKHFFIEKQGFQFLKLWSRPKGGPHALHPLVPPLLHFKIFTHQNLARNHPILTKTVSFHEKKHFFI